MIKTLLISIMGALLLISPVTTETVTLPDEIHQKTIISKVENDVSFEFFQVYEDPRFDVNYGYSISSRHDVSLEITCAQGQSIQEDINVLLYKEVTSSFHPNEFVGVCKENDEANIILNDKNGELINANFTYRTTLNSTATTYTTTGLYTSSADIPDTALPYTIAVATILLIGGILILLYRRKYQSYLNQTLEEKPNIKKPKLDVPSFISVSTVIAIVLIAVTLTSIHYIYKNTYIYDVSVEEKSVEILNMDLSNITLDEAKYQQFTVTIDLDIVSTSTYENDLVIASPESLSTYTTNILNEHEGTIVNYNDYSMNFVMESQKRYFLSYSTDDESTIEFRFILDEENNPHLYVYYFPPDDTSYYSQDGLIQYRNPEYFFTVSEDNPNFIAIYNLLTSQDTNNTS